MESTWFRFRGELRTRWPAWVGLAVVVGLAAGTTLALVAGARRTSSAYGRFVAAQDAEHVSLVSGIPGTFDFAELDLEAVAELRQVAASSALKVLAFAGRTESGELVAGLGPCASAGTARAGLVLRCLV